MCVNPVTDQAAEHQAVVAKHTEQRAAATEREVQLTAQIATLEARLAQAATEREAAQALARQNAEQNQVLAREKDDLTQQLSAAASAKTSLTETLEQARAQSLNDATEHARCTTLLAQAEAAQVTLAEQRDQEKADRVAALEAVRAQMQRLEQAKDAVQAEITGYREQLAVRTTTMQTLSTERETLIASLATAQQTLEAQRAEHEATARALSEAHSQRRAAQATIADLQARLKTAEAGQSERLETQLGHISGLLREQVARANEVNEA